jgi:hypothetical protein
MTIIQLHYDPDGRDRRWLMEELEVEPLGAQRFRLLETPLLSRGRLNLRDVIEVESRPEGGYALLAVAERSGWRAHDWLIGPDVMESAALRAFRDKVEASGGQFELPAGGMVRVLLPPGSEFDVQGAMDVLLGMDRQLAAPPPARSYRSDSRPGETWWKFWKK